jgi:acetyl-CoA carboxylase carboxyltransferase component
MIAIVRSTVPWCTMIVRKVFGVAGSAHQRAESYCLRYAWPSGDWGSLPVEGGLEAAYKGEIAAAADPKAKLAEIEARLEALRSPFRAVESFVPEDIIDPRDTRPLLCAFADMAAAARRAGPVRQGLRP